MKLRFANRRARAAAGICFALVFVVFTADALAKPIRLRNQLIDTPLPKRGQAGGQAAGASNSGSTQPGLYLVQFERALTAQAAAQLKALGVDLLQSIPEDTFIVRMEPRRVTLLESLPLVHWVGQYRAEHKVHPQLQARARAASAATTVSRVSIILAPRANQSEVAAVRRTFNVVQQEAKAGRFGILRGNISHGQLQALANSGAVLWVEPAEPLKLVDEVASKILAGDGGPHKLTTQVMGLDGTGVAVAVADTGLDTGNAGTMHPDLQGRTPAFFQYGKLTDAADEHSHGTHVAGIIAGNGAVGEVDENGALYGLGVAPGAQIIAQRIFDGAGAEELPPSFEKMTRDATRAGAVIGSNSWGTDNQGRYDSYAMEFDALVRDADQLQSGDQQYILEFSAGNAGPGVQTVGTPAVAKNVITTGASENDRPDLFIYADGIDAVADFSSRGPCEDGRIKPDVVAPGTWISSLKSSMASDENSWSPISDYYLYMGGTSQAGPHASGAAAVFVQYYRLNHGGSTPSPALVKAALITSAVDMYDDFGTGPIPNMDEGWGRIDLLNLVDPGMRLEYVDQTALLTDSQVYEHRVLIASREQPLKITMAYTDVPGFPGAVPALVNDLDLEVVAPDGTLYKGNQMDAGESMSNPTSRDSLNNVEVMQLSSAPPGEYIIRVRARKIADDAREDTAAFDQDFALVISGSLAQPGVGEVSLDRAMYTAPDRIKVTVVDTALAGAPSTQVRVQSTTETVGEILVLTPASSSGVYTGAIATARGPAQAGDNVLQVAHNDTIEVRFQEPNGPLRTATALADLAPPVLSGVTAAASFGATVVTWSSDESADSTVWFGTNSAAVSLTNRVREAELTTSHSVSLLGLSPGATYYYFVVSVDEAGNISTNNNGGSFFSFVSQATPPVLLVDQYQNDVFNGPPLTGYTAALDQVGVGYDVYDPTAKGPPDFKKFKAYPVMILRVPEFSLAWTPQDLIDISNYVSEGGTILVSSMEVLSRLGGSTNFSRGVLQVQSFLTDENGSMGAQQIVGVPGDPVAGNVNVTMDYTPYDEAWADLIAFGVLTSSDLSDAITPTTTAKPILRNDYGQVVGLRWQGPNLNSGRVVFLSFPLDAVPLATGDRANLLRNILTFLAPQAPNLESMSLDSVAYTLPSVVNVQLGDARLSGGGTLTATATTTSDPGGISFTLYETARKGLFMGSFNVYALTNPQQPAILEAQNGNTLNVNFTDAAAGVNLSASAAIDTQPPSISNVSGEAEYITANVWWDTSEIADALVQYGESPLLGQTAYDPSPTTSHFVSISGLAPNRTYYYRVISRDLAGNMKTDDNAGHLYTFQTLAPLAAPWTDNMNTSATNWTVLTAEGSQGEWTLGTPTTGPGSAHSAPDAWGSNLNSEFLDVAESFLVSPAFMITNGNSATLSFWHWYDFTDLSGQGYDIEFGSVELVVDNSPPQTIAMFGDVSGGWEHTEIDLSPYIGHLIYVAWHYFLFSLDPWPRPGWFVDDVAVSVSDVQAGTIVVTNNLSQAEWVLSGRTYVKGKGSGMTITNAGPGEYILEFADVPYYNTPQAQTNTLSPGAKLVMTGTYTFPDANNNGISDLWETKYFGTVSPTRTATTDTDNDGATDYAEFIAGTDPNNATSELKVAAQLLPNEQLNVSWTGATGRNYRVEASTNGTTWQPVSDWIRSGSANTITYQVIPGTNSGMTLFRVVVRQ